MHILPHKQKQNKSMHINMKQLLILALTTCVLTYPALAADKCNPQDKAALLRIKSQLGNPSDLSTWNASTDCCAGWKGVSCDTDTQTYRVNNLDLTAITLQKATPIPPSIGDLPSLNFLTLSQITNLAGTIPNTLTKLTKLRYLYISHTSVSGTIPDFLSSIKTVVTLDFSYNKLSGALPASLSSLPNLVGITFDGNSLSGQIPSSYGSFSSEFTSMTLSQNKLSGVIPTSLSNLNLAIVDLSGNSLVGDASVLFGAKKNTQKIALAKNGFAFDIGKVGFSPNLNTLDLRNNGISGTLPQSLTQLKFLKKFNVSYNSLCGQIPQGGNLQRFDAYAYAGNKCLCGSPLPSC